MRYKQPQVSLLHHQKRNLLSCVAVVVCNTCLAHLSGDILLCVNEFLNESDCWTLSDEGFVNLLDRLAAQEWADVMPIFRTIQVHFAVVEAMKRGNLAVLMWQVNSYYRG